MNHPADYFVRYLLIKEPTISDANIDRKLRDWGILKHNDDNYIPFLRQKIGKLPDNFDPKDRTHRVSMNILREHKVYDLFFPTDPVQEAWEILADPRQRLFVEQALLAHLDPKTIAIKLNKKFTWHLTAEGIQKFGHFFWNVNLLTFDEWGKFLSGRTVLYERFMGLLEADPSLAFHHLKVEQTMESRLMLQRAQEIAYYTLEEVALKPGTDGDKVKAIGVLGKMIVDTHNALSTSDMALKDVLKQFERFRMEYPQGSAKDIKQLAPAGNFSGSGAEFKEKDKDKEKN